jgi:hypothetical protein
MSNRGLSFATILVAAVALVTAVAHFAWEQHRYRLWTPKGVFRIGMTAAEVETIFGSPPYWSGRPSRGEFRCLAGALLLVRYDERRRIERITVLPFDRSSFSGHTTIPRPSLFEHIPAWLAGGRRGE